MENIKENLKYIIYWTIIFIVSISMIIYGIAKPIQFANFTSSTNINLSQGHKLMWSFYSYSLTYPIIIGVFEIIGGITLLFYRTRILGCILLTVILSNVIIQDFVYEVTALNSAIFYQVLVLIIIFFDFKKLKNILVELLKFQNKKKNLILLIIALCIALIIKYFETKIL
ncbi:hypothetical protein J3S90_14260 [Flavobacterium sp. P4023]|uniref:DoxX protein n=1 Tax=Flavobacterium flabelliforme TaxID=2816119 RepID=A0ABS5CWG9_9FLAO|nr:hypothetical protein [Flavobacterium flabelliforme]MBP4142967.1 hypothetical protein [Flavobacterium flabelliforme]